MSRYDDASTSRHQQKEPFRVGKRTNSTHKKGGRGAEAWSKKGKGGGKDANAGITPLKHRLRSLSRLLSNNGKLPADVKIAHEREIQALQHELANLLLDKEKHEMIGKYHKVRFFERQKATRQLKKATKGLEACEHASDWSAWAKRVHVSQVDVNYTQYYPYMTVYQSLWKREKDEDGEEHYTANDEQEDGAKGNVEVWRQVEKAMTNNTLDKLKDIVDEAKMDKIRKTVASFGGTPSGLAKAKPSKDIEADEEEEEDETGAGFFE